MSAGGAPTPDDPRRCSARRTSGAPCRAWAVKGTGVCRVHGGMAPQVRAAGLRRLEAERQAANARRLAEHRLGGEIDVDPLEALEEAVRRSAAIVWALGELVADLPGARAVTEEHYLDDGERYESITEPGLWGPNHLGDDAPHVLVNLYRAALADHAKIAKAAADAGVSERGQSLREAEGAVIATLIAGLLADPRLELTPAQRHAGRELASARLQALEAETIDVLA